MMFPRRNKDHENYEFEAYGFLRHGCKARRHVGSQLQEGSAMLVHIALKKGGERELGAKISDCVHRAVDAALDLADEAYFQIVTDQALDLTARPRQSAAKQKDVAVIVLIYPKVRPSEKKKRMLFGGIGESLEVELQVRRTDIVVGVIDPQGDSWFCGGDQMKLEQMMAGQLP
jgi:phenylpyruvate tautomerase PptA (4-oxalocrotonate tautomerase family)